MGTEHDTALLPKGVTLLTHAGAARTLLFPRLGTGTRDFAAGLRACLLDRLRVLDVRVDDLMQKVLVDFTRIQTVVQIKLTDDFSVRCIDIDFHFAPVFLMMTIACL